MIKGNTNLADWRFILVMWAASRTLIVIVMVHLAPLLPVPPGGVPAQAGWAVFTHWDGGWYGRVAHHGYHFDDDTKQYSVAFFPLFPLISRSFMGLGLSFDVAGTLVNNFAFLGALFVFFAWVKDSQGTQVARWATACLAWCPFSLFTAVAYSEGLFFLFTSASLAAFQRARYAQAAIWGALATATRVTGTALLPAMMLAAWVEKKPLTAYLAGLATAGGIALFSLYCALHFDDPLAFIHAQQGWRTNLGFDWPGWLNIFIFGLTGPVEWQVYPPSGGFSKVIMVFGGGLLLWRLRAQLSPVAVAYGIFALALILASGSVTSVDRYAYSIVPLAFGLGMVIAHHPRWGWALMLYFALLLANFALRFAQQLWVA